MTPSAKPVQGQHSLNPLHNDYIPPVYLPNLKKYKYSGADFSILGRYVLQPYWNFVVSLVPMTVAPNRITFTGFLVGMSATVLLLYHYFFESGDFPSWMLYYAAFALFAYQTLDAIDGKQARRTGTGSPLGELFDHGCDAFITPFVIVNVTLAISATPTERFWTTTLTCLGLFTAIWEQFSTGSFDLGYISGPTEGIITNCIVFLLSATFGESIWQQSVIGPLDIPYPEALSFLFPSCHGTARLESARSLLFVTFVVLCLVTIVTNALHVLVRPTVHSSKLVPYVAAVPIVLASLLTLHVFVQYPEAQRRFPFALEVSYGLLLSITVTRLTLARLCIMPYKILNWYCCLFLFTVSAASAMPYVGYGVVSSATVETCLGWALEALTLFAILQYGHMIMSVFTEMARFLNISIMTIGPKKAD